jgi:hypothetical protein
MRDALVLDALDMDRWDSFVRSHPNGWVCHLAGWKRMLEHSFERIRGYYIVVTDQGSSKIEAALPIYHVRSWFTGNRLVSIPFGTLSGPLISCNEHAEAIVNSVHGLARKLNCAHIDIGCLQSSEFMENCGFVRSDFYQHHYLTLDRSPEDLRKRFHHSCVRQRIAKAMKSDILIRHGCSETDMRRFYALYLFTRRKICLPPKPYRFFQQLWQCFGNSGHMTLLLAEKDGRAIGSVVLLKGNGRISAEWAVSDPQYKKLNANHYLFWEAIQMGCREGYSVFDFGRTAPTNNGLMKFKDRWGTDVVGLPRFTYPDRAKQEVSAKENLRVYRLAKSLFRLSPDPLFRLFGEVYYGHVA